LSSKTIALVALAALALLASACAGVGKPNGWASPEIEGSLYVSLERGRLSALDPATYEVEWEFPASDEFSCGGGSEERWELEGIYEAPALDDETLYFGAYDGAVYAVDRERATCKWRFETGDPIVGGVVLTDEGLYVPSEDGFLYLLDPEDGSEKTKRQVGDTWATPLVLDDAVYVATIDGKLWKLEPGTLEPLWDEPFSVSAALLTAPTLNPSGGVLVGGIGKKLYLVSEESGAEVWSASGANWFWGRPVVDGNVIYATNLGKEVKAINAEDGSERWTFKTETSVRAGVVVAGDVVVAVDDQGNVYRLGSEDGSLQGQPSRLEQTVHATPLLLGVSRPGTGSPTRTPAGEAETEVLISTKDGNLWVLNVTRGTVTEVVR
jgi:outer membrane protein assembly factor BamB